MMSLEKKNRTYPLLSVGTDAKTIKGKRFKVLTGILFLAPWKEAGVGNFCGNASPECIKLCLFTSGRAAIHPTVNLGRIRKTHFFANDREGFNTRLYRDLRGLIRKAKRDKMRPAARLDGTSDIGIATQVCEDFPTIAFYDYTKNPQRMQAFLDGSFPENYHLTFSRSEINDSEAEAFLAKGAGVAYVFKDIPQTYLGYRVIPGDESDIRYLDRKLFDIPDNEGYVIGLTPKGKAKKHTSEFVI